MLAVSLRPIPPGARFDPIQLRIGTRVELEHTTDIATAQLIAMHHLLEDPDYYRKLRTIHLDGTQLGDTRSDIVNTLAVVLGRTKAEELMRGFETLIQTKAREGAESAIPKIKAEVIKAVTGQTPEIRREVEKAARGAVKPLVIGAIATGAIGGLFGLLALIKLKRSR